MRHRVLQEGWFFREAREPCGYYRPCVPDDVWRPAQVPGHVHLDLVREGLLPEPFRQQFERGCQWVDESDWEYRTTFHWEPDANLPRRLLRFEGLDTVADVHLNGEFMGRADNMFVPHEFDATDRLRPGENALSVRFRSAVRSGMERRETYFAQEGLRQDTTFFDERAFVRKCQSMSGWDWGPRLVSCGIWKPVSLIEFARRIERFMIRILPEGEGFRVLPEVRIEDASGALWNPEDAVAEGLELQFDGKVVDPRGFLASNPERWEPYPVGSPRLYDLKLRLGSDDSTVRRIGFRTVELVREPDAWGECFHFRVNGRTIFAAGANWIPNDAFPSRTTADDYRKQVEVCKNLGMNMLRVWGGGLIEDDSFYDACDQAGILVWQDFPFACSYYPDDEASRAAYAREAEAAIARLAHHPSLALWCGNNECGTMWQSRWGADELIPPRFHGEAVFSQLLADAVSGLDPGRPYIATSPIGESPDAAADPAGHTGCNMGGYGDQHFWDVWHGRGDWRHYADSHARFCSEFGFASSCSEEAWSLASVDVRHASLRDAWVRSHDRTGKPADLFESFVELHYPRSRNLRDWIYFSQLNQRDALRFAVEGFRLSPACAGALIWQFNDCWPVQSWAVQDYARKLKPAGHELRRLFAPTLLAWRVADGRARLWVQHEGRERYDGQVVVRRARIPGSDGVRTETMPLSCEPGESRLVVEFELEPASAGAWLLIAEMAGAPETRTALLLGEPKDVADGGARVEAQVGEVGLELQIEGAALDLVVEGAGKWPWAGRAWTLLDETLTLPWGDSGPGPVRIRWLDSPAWLDVPLIGG